MFARASTSILSILLLLVVCATAQLLPTSTISVPSGPTSIPAGNCNTGTLQCCNQVQQANVPPVSTILALLGIVVDPVTALIGLTCNPISLVDVLNHQCQANPVCCQNNNIGGLLSIGCIPVSL